MFDKRHGVRLIFALSALIATNVNAFEESDLPQLRKQVSAACPAMWESIYSRLLYETSEVQGNEPGETVTIFPDIWQGVATDKSRYITYALNRLIPASNQAGGQLTLEYASAHGSVITACASERVALLETLIQTRNDETGGFNINVVKDDDSDGVFNISDSCPALFQTCVEALDICPDTPESEPADDNGCSISQRDTDNDGVNDLLDTCNETPVGEAADIDGLFIGCSLSQKDTDEDGFFDDVDVCPGSDIGLVVNIEGCAINEVDTDGDGINDFEDEYPHQDAFMCYP
jgi:hypothetical protein